MAGCFMLRRCCSQLSVIATAEPKTLNESVCPSSRAAHVWSDASPGLSGNTHRLPILPWRIEARREFSPSTKQSPALFHCDRCRIGSVNAEERKWNKPQREEIPHFHRSLFFFFSRNQSYGCKAHPFMKRLTTLAPVNLRCAREADWKKSAKYYAAFRRLNVTQWRRRTWLKRRRCRATWW